MASMHRYRKSIGDAEPGTTKRQRKSSHGNSTLNEKNPDRRTGTEVKTLSGSREHCTGKQITPEKRRTLRSVTDGRGRPDRPQKMKIDTRPTEHQHPQTRFRSCHTKSKEGKMNSTSQIQNLIFLLKSHKIQTTIEVTILTPSFH
jgi:hypothetical protein